MQVFSVIVGMAISASISAASALRGDLEIEILEVLPHPGPAFTQGLIVDEGLLIESSGRYGGSYVQGYKPAPEPAVTGVGLDERIFAEGLVRMGEQYFVLTWRAGAMLVLDRETMQMTGVVRYAGEGWGLTTDGTNLVMSDGSDVLSFRDPGDLSIRRQVTVTRNGQPLRHINELEWVNGQVLANIWQTDWLVVIDPESGQVVAQADLGLLRDHLPEGQRVDVLNGIAWDPESGDFYLTGKLWPILFRVRLNNTE